MHDPIRFWSRRVYTSKAVLPFCFPEARLQLGTMQMDCEAPGSQASDVRLLSQIRHRSKQSQLQTKVRM